MPLMTGRTQLVFMAEVTPGTAVTLENAGGLAVGAEMVLASDITWDADATATPVAAMSGAFGNRGSVSGPWTVKVGFKTHLRGATTFAGPAYPDTRLPFQACGCSVTQSGAGGSEIVTVAPVSAITSTFTIGVYNDGVLYRAAGCLGNVKFTFKTGEPVLAEWEMTGAYVPPSDVALRSSNLVVATPTPPAFLSAALSVTGYANARIESMTLDLGRTVVMAQDPNTTYGNYRAAITGIGPNGTIDPESVIVATKPWYAEWITGTPASITTGTFPSTGTQYNKLNLTMPKSKFTKVTKGDRGGISTAPINFEVRDNVDAGNDSFSLVFS